MGFRFRKSISLGKGVRINFNKKSAGISFGTKGARYSVNSNGRRTASVGIPGTGLYYTKTSGGSSHKKTSQRKSNTNTKHTNNYNSPNTPNENVCKKCGTVNESNTKICSNCGTKLDTVSNTAIILWLVFFFPVGLYLMWKKSDWNKTVKIALSLIIAVLMIICTAFSAPTDNIPTSKTGITEITSIYPSDSVEFDLSNSFISAQTVSFNVKSQSDWTQNDLKVISTNSDVATAELTAFAYNTISVKISGVSAGTTEIYLQTSDDIVKSNTIKVICTNEITTASTTAEEKTTAEETTRETTKKETTKPSTTEKKTEKETKKDKSRTVYTTPYGKKYHYSKDCAGENAIKHTLNEVKGAYGPCKKCAQ